MLEMRVRITELMERPHAPAKNAYQLAALVSRYEISRRSAFRLVAAEGRIDRLDMRLADALCQIFDVSPNELLEREPIAGDPPASRAARKRQRRPAQSRAA